MEKSPVTRTPEQEAHLSEQTRRGTVAVQTDRRARALRALHQGQRAGAVARPRGGG